MLKAISVGGEKVALTRRYYLNDLLLKVRLGDEVIFSIVRDGKEMDVTISFDNEAHFAVYK